MSSKFIYYSEKVIKIWPVDFSFSKVHIIWERHKNMMKSQTLFDATKQFQIKFGDFFIF